MHMTSSISRLFTCQSTTVWPQQLLSRAPIGPLSSTTAPRIHVVCEYNERQDWKQNQILRRKRKKNYEMAAQIYVTVLIGVDYGYFSKKKREVEKGKTLCLHFDFNAFVSVAWTLWARRHGKRQRGYGEHFGPRRLARPP